MAFPGLETVFVRHDAVTPSDVRPIEGRDTIVVFGGSARTLDMLRLASIRSDDLILAADEVDAAARRFVDRFAVDHRSGPFPEAVLQGAAAAVIAIGDVARENRMVRAARRLGVPIHVEGRPLVSDFTMLELVERSPASFAAGTASVRMASLMPPREGHGLGWCLEHVRV